MRSTTRWPSRGRPRGKREEGGAVPEARFVQTLRRLIRGDVGFLIQSVRDNMERARVEMNRESDGRLDHRLSHDVAVVSGTALVMASLKMLKFLPGVPFAPGIKGVILLPLYVLASQRTWSRWGGTAAGSIMGVVGFLQGDGRFGVLDILQHVAPGRSHRPADAAGEPVAADRPHLLCARLRRHDRPDHDRVCCRAAARARAPRSISFRRSAWSPMPIAGTLSGFVTIYLLRAFPKDEISDTRTESSGEHAEEHVVRRTGQGL